MISRWCLHHKTHVILQTQRHSGPGGGTPPLHQKASRECDATPDRFTRGKEEAEAPRGVSRWYPRGLLMGRK